MVAGLVLVVLAVIGALLPVMPSTVFAVGAAACFARSSPRLEAWLLAHRWFGPSIRAWRADGAIPLTGKVVAVGSMAVSGAGVALAAPPGPAMAAGAVLAGSAAFVLSRPTAKAGAPEGPVSEVPASPLADPPGDPSAVAPLASPAGLPVGPLPVVPLGSGEAPHPGLPVGPPS
jgi:uncharacterized membrane protein YbaN (DUF454 family)